jgi:Spy/CpxP family protein refolding chaperone
MADAQFEAMLERRAMRNEVRAVLTPEQREQAARMEGRMQGRMQGRGMNGQGRRGMGSER